MPHFGRISLQITPVMSSFKPRPVKTMSPKAAPAAQISSKTLSSQDTSSRGMTLSEFLSIPVDPESAVKKIHTHIEGEGMIQVLRNTFNLVLSRDLKKNVRLA